MFKGEKVLLRPMKQEDVARLHEFNQDPELYVLDSSYPRASALQAAQTFYESRTKPNEETVGFAIEADGKYIGDCGLGGLKDRHGNLELGIGIGDRDYWGRGYGRDAVKLLLHYGFHYCGARRIFLTTHAKNERAIRCYLACGFVEEGRSRQAAWIDGEYIDLVNMSILREEWQARNERSNHADGQ
jgi:RimJ/RimL family protein N-acetyltransferase